MEQYAPLASISTKRKLCTTEDVPNVLFASNRETEPSVRLL
jgi:hypothetical protein